MRRQQSNCPDDRKQSAQSVWTNALHAAGNDHSGRGCEETRHDNEVLVPPEPQPRARARDDERGTDEPPLRLLGEQHAHTRYGQ
ncbi:MAG: hypothetical protein MJE77_28150 [Proteobacteria bacterium]|nr:hypothetical protein [Pseudomonadota bacterium]